jgi:glycine/D-amino acid oxidase-like deaminating enzyme
MQGKHVAIIGCGSVGGHAALAMAFAGVGRLTLIDPDEMSIENTYRHCLGRAAVGSKKTTALAAEIKHRLPGVRIDDHPFDAGHAMSHGLFAREDVELAIVAIGHTSESRYLNSSFRTAGMPAVFAWLEPLGLGGHALATLPGVVGCYECLFTEHDGSEQLYARSDFAAAGQKFSRDIAGCATTFTPYGDLDARRTAEVAARLALDVLSERETRGALVSWKGDAHAFEAAGFQVSDRWELTEDGLRAARTGFMSAGCPQCARRGE